MREHKNAMPVMMDQPGAQFRSPGAWGGMTVLYSEYRKRLDMRRYWRVYRMTCARVLIGVMSLQELCICSTPTARKCDSER